MTLFQSMTLEDCACAAILAFFSMQGAVPFIAPNQALEIRNVTASGWTYWGGIATQLAVYGVICLLVVADLPRVLRWIGAMRWTGAMAVLAIASSAWSQFPSGTLRRSIPFALAAVFGFYLAIRFPVRRQIDILWTAMTAVALGTILMALFFPTLGLDASVGHAGDWQGVFTSKNACGRIMVLATAVTLSRPNEIASKTLSLALFIFIMVMSGSRGAWLIEALILATYIAVRFSRVVNFRNRVFLFGSGIFIAAIAAAAGATHIASLAHFLGRNATLTGRTEIWKQIWPFIMERPVLGWGYAGFFRGTQGESFRVAAALRFVVLHAHNGLMEIWLELGAVGVFLFAGSYLRAWRKLRPRLRAGQIERVIWLLFVLILIALYDLDENTLLIYNGLFWVIYVASLVDIELLAVEEQLADHLAVLLTDKISPEERSAAPA